MQSIELFNGTIKASPHLIIINFIVIVHFFFSYYFLSYKKGYKVDYWHFTIFIGYILPFMIIYPFSASDLNYYSIGNKIYFIQDLVDKAYLITLVGYTFTYIGFYYHDIFFEKGIIYSTIDRTNSIVSRLMFFSIRSKLSFSILYLIGITLAGLFIILVFSKYGVSFNIRANILNDISLRPLYNFIMVTFLPIIIVICLIRFFGNKTKQNFILALLLIILLLFSGSRSSLMTPILTAFVIYFISQKNKIKLFNIVIFGFLVLYIVVYLGEIRKGNFSFIDVSTMLFTSIVYGNNFSDIRDFAWILAYWDNEYIYGKSYLAAIFSFVPRSFSDLRELWAISVYTSNLTGLDPNVHAGLRPGKFGEAFLNFGYLGVIILGFITGYILRFTDIKIKLILKNGEGNDYIKLYSQTVTYTLASYFFITASFWKFYIMLFIIILGHFLYEILKKQGAYK